MVLLGARCSTDGCGQCPVCCRHRLLLRQQERATSSFPSQRRRGPPGPGSVRARARSLRQVLAILRNEPVPDEPADPLATAPMAEASETRSTLLTSPVCGRRSTSSRWQRRATTISCSRAHRAPERRCLPADFPDCCLTSAPRSRSRSRPSIRSQAFSRRTGRSSRVRRSPTHITLRRSCRRSAAVVGAFGPERPVSPTWACCSWTRRRVRAAGARRPPPTARARRNRDLSCPSHRGVPGPFSSRAGGQPCKCGNHGTGAGCASALRTPCGGMACGFPVRSAIGSSEVCGRAARGREPGRCQYHERTEQGRGGSGGRGT